MLSMEVKRVNLWDGGDRHNFGFFISADVPDKEIELANPHCFIQKQVLTVFESLREVTENDQKNIRWRAWEKLPPMEREALGMKEPK